MTYLRRILLLISVLTALVTTSAVAQAPASPNPFEPVTKVQGGLVNTRVNATYDAPGVPFLAFQDALKTYPKARQFRVSWGLLIFNNYTETTILYDRSRHTLRLYSTGSGDVVGSYQDHLLYTRVRETILEKIAAAHKSDSYDASSESWFTDLPKQGCRKHDLGSWEKPPKHPQSGDAFDKNKKVCNETSLPKGYWDSAALCAGGGFRRRTGDGSLAEACTGGNPGGFRFNA